MYPAGKQIIAGWRKGGSKNNQMAAPTATPAGHEALKANFRSNDKAGRRLLGDGLVAGF
jgi:hypothetical protein